jgi:hypothetical protein
MPQTKGRTTFHRGDTEAQRRKGKKDRESAEGAEVPLSYPDDAFIEDRLFSRGER